MVGAGERARGSGGGRTVVAALALGGVLLASACASSRVYADPDGPRWAGPGGAPPPSTPGPDTLRVASFNLEFGEDVEGAIEVLTSQPELAAADVVLLQEMDEAGTERVARALGMGWVYYPAGYRYASERNFGNAVLSRWPIVDDAKVLLPYTAVFGRSRRIATAATIEVDGTPVRVYSVHLATPVNQAFPERREQMRTVLRDAEAWPRVVVGGDLNSGGMGDLLLDRGYAWPTREGPRTLLFGRWDHVFFRGLEPLDAGTGRDVADASDHRPVWAVGIVR